MKRVLLLTNMYPSEKYPAYGIFVKKTYEWLKKEYEVTLVKMYKSDHILQKMIRYGLFYGKAILYGIFGNYDCIYAHYISHCAFPVRCIKSIRPDIKVVGNIHGEDVFSEFKEYRHNRMKSKMFIENSTYIISPSLYFKERLCREYGVDKYRIFVSPSGGVDTGLFVKKNKSDCRKKAGLESDKKYVGFVSRIEKGKGWDIFLSALEPIMKADSHVNAIVIGAGREMPLMKRRISELGIANKVILISSADHNKLVLLYNSMDVFCFPTRREAESLGLVGLEAMACEVPCVITSLYGPSSYAKDGYNCYQFHPDHEKELRNKLEKLLSEKEERVYILTQNARATALEYDAQKVEKDFLLFFRKILGNTCNE